MRIAFVTQPWDEVSPPVGGPSSISIIVYQLARRLVRHGHEVIIYAKRGQAQPAAEHDSEGITYRRVSTKVERLLLSPIRLLDRLGVFWDPKTPFFASSLFYRGYAVQMARDLKDRQPDIIHIMNLSQYVPLIRRCNADAKFVLHMECEWLSQLDRSMISRRLDKTDLVVGCSDYITGKVRLHFPQFADRCHAVYNGVDAGQFSRRNGEAKTGEDKVKRLLFVGRVSPEKGVHVLLDAFQAVAECYPQAQLDLVGPVGSAPIEYMVRISDDEKVSNLASFYGKVRKGDYLAQLQGRIPPKLVEQVNFVGSVPHSDLAGYYRRADILVNPSLTEAFGMSLVEAMASGVPVVAARVGGMTEIVGRGEAGILVEAGDARDLARALINLLDNEGRRRSMGQAGPERVAELYTWDRVSEMLLHHYAGLGAQAG